MRIVVAMTTCDAEHFLASQLESILRQTRLPDALVVSDDASGDRTITMLKTFRDRAPFPVVVLRNERRLGLFGNTARALEVAVDRGDVVCLCDDDDEWDAGKIEAARDAFLRHPKVTLWLSDGVLIGPDGQQLGMTLREFLSLDRAAMKRLEEGDAIRTLMWGATVTAGASAFRATTVPVALPFPSEIPGSGLFSQDGWVAAIAYLMGDAAVDDRFFLRYRRYDGQMSERRSGSEQEAADRRRADLHRLAAATAMVMRRVRERQDVVWESSRVAELSAFEDFLQVRTMAAGRRDRMRAILKQLIQGGYRRFARGWRTAALDMYRISS